MKLHSLRLHVPFLSVLAIGTLFLAAACSSDAPTPPNNATPSQAASVLALATDPGAAVGVVAAKAKGPQTAVVVEGRIHDITKGFAIFKLMDSQLDYCGQTDTSDGCRTPWDYCCESKADRVANSLLVEARDADGDPIGTPALPNVRHCDLVKVTGELTKDAHGNLVLVMSGIFQVERPTLRDNVKWPGP